MKTKNFIAAMLVVSGLSQAQNAGKKWFKVTVNDQVGIVDERGNQVLIPAYDEIGPIGEGPNNWTSVTSLHMKGFMDENGCLVVPVKYSEIHPFDEISEGSALVKWEGYYGFIDRSGREVVEPTYDSLEQIYPPKSSR